MQRIKFNRWRRGTWLMPVVVASLLSLMAVALRGESKPQASHWTQPWGRVRAADVEAVFVAELDLQRASYPLPPQLPAVTRAYLGSVRWPGEPVGLDFDPETGHPSLHFDEPPAAGTTVVMETADQSQLFRNGRITLSAADARVIGQKAKLETNARHDRIGFWTDAADQVQWNYAATRPGRYTLWLTYSLALPRGQQGSTISLQVGDQTLRVTLAGTGSWYRYHAVPLGKLRLPKQQSYAIAVACSQPVGGAVMNLKAVTLLPTNEGVVPEAKADGSIVLHAQHATTHSVQMQWEPRQSKRTLGFWTKPQDQASWTFEVPTAGRYAVQILQGCGAGQGGSRVEFAFFANGKATPHDALAHQVIDTGHWQAFQPVDLGAVQLPAGSCQLWVRPQSKSAVAVMDLRQVTLTPQTR